MWGRIRNGIENTLINQDRIQRRLDSANKTLELARTVEEPDLVVLLAYDSVRKSADALLESYECSRTTKNGTHTTVMSKAAQILADIDGYAAQRMQEAGDWLRLLRNVAEYGDVGEITAIDAMKSVTLAQYLVPTIRAIMGVEVSKRDDGVDSVKAIEL